MSEELFPDGIEKISEKEEEELKEPDMFRVVLHNDNFTTMNFVVEVLMQIFHKSIIEATKIMLAVHRKGRGEVGEYTYDIASTKVHKVRRMAKARQFPLKCTCEKI